MPELTHEQFESLDCRKISVSYNEYGGYCFPLNSMNRPVVRHILDRQVWEPETIQYIRENCSGNIVHAGAYFGDFFPAIAPVCETLYAFEPCRESFECARMTQWINRLENIHLENAGLGSERMKLKLKTNDGTLGGNSRITDDGDEEIQIIPLDELSLENISILQLDVEGFEQEALKGALDTIYHNQPTLILEVLEDSPLMETDGWFANTIIAMGYRMEAIIEGNVVFRTSN